MQTQKSDDKRQRKGSRSSRREHSAYYDAIAASYEELHGEEQEKKYEMILANLPPLKGKRVLDVGCGTGLLFKHLEGSDCHGIDLSEELIRRVPKKYAARVQVAPAEDLPFPGSAFDIIISVTALQNMMSPKQAIDEMKRVGKKAFAISFLKKSAKRETLERLLRKAFPSAIWIEEEKDLIMIAK